MEQLNDLLDRISALKAKADAHGPLSPEAKMRLEQKIRMEWNYHSNVMEGNQLSYGETRSLLLHGLTANGKPIKDHLDMKGHNEALKQLEKVAADKEPLSKELLIKFHKIILIDPYNEHPELQIGQFKRTNNYVETRTGEPLLFLPWEQVEEELDKLITSVNKQLAPVKQGKYPKAAPLLIAATFHQRFLHIHPFNEGNGRLARLFMNLILLQCGYPPVIIKKEDRDAYFNALEKSQQEGISILAAFLGEQLVRSLELYLTIANGGDAEEEDDLDKEVALLYQSLKGKPKTVIKSKKVVQQIVKETYTRFLGECDLKLNIFKKLFETASWKVIRKPEGDTTLPDILGLVTVTIDAKTIIRHHTTEVMKLGEAHDMETIFLLKRFNDEDDSFDVELTFDLEFREKECDLKIFIGKRNERTDWFKATNALREMASKGQFKADTIDEVLTTLSYNRKPKDDEIRSWAHAAAKQVNEYIKRQVAKKQLD